ncbi:hypothetical protein GTC6_03475 [Gordonia terrae C-6]|uniref:Uncharacterized protein n=1 Tax=Gordonia terrae C-6 TaxID=1316928 RepID=R7YD87_9ACTN|nr:hypothetical protein [Gordonia terrae]EON34005.1 hypothetical protein GTC6_03475 [Gordonia terrae C-6]
MLRVYLDQSKWIDLTKCRVGKPDGARYTEVLDLARAAVGRGQVSFVLSCAHYFETQRRGTGRSRRELGETMAELSKFHAIAPVQKIVPAEIREYLTGEPLQSQLDLFGVGFKHAFDTSFDLVAGFKLTSEDSLPPAVRTEIKSRIREEVEKAILAAPEDAPKAARKMLEAASQIHASSQTFADEQANLSRAVVDQQLRGQLEDVAVMTEAADIFVPLRSECARIGIDPVDVISSKQAIYDLVQGLPSRWVMSQLRRVRLRNPQQPWTRNDLNDLSFMSIAVPYCDVVVTERQWARHINQLDLAHKHNTKIYRDLTDLIEVLTPEPKPDN